MSAALRLVGDATGTDRPDAAAGDPLLGAPVSYHRGGAHPVSMTSPHDLPEHLSRFGPRPATTGSAGDGLLSVVDAAGLTGHGGGHFPVAAKWRAHLDAGGGGVVVANAAESEPASAKDLALLQFRPHLVLDGVACAADAVGAEDIVLWFPEESHRARRALTRALAERRAANLVEPAMRLVGAPDRYVSGESSAIVRTLRGGPTLPTFRREPGSDAHGRPILVHNLETLARIGRIARGGVRHHRTCLLTVAHGDTRTVVEVDPVAGLGQAVDAITGLGGDALQAVLVGGYGGTWYHWDRFARLHADATFRRAPGTVLGAGVVIPVTADECGLAQASRVADYLADSSARQCGPCLFGLRATANLLAEIVGGRSHRRDLPRLRRFLDAITGRGACHHPDGAVRMIRSAITTFAADVESHLRRGVCLHPPRAPYVSIAAMNL